MKYMLSGMPLHIVLLVTTCVLIASGIATWKLADIPFGPIFNAVFHIAYGSLVLLLVLSGIGCLRCRGWWRKACGGILTTLALTFFVLLAVLHIDYTSLPMFDVNKNLSRQAWHEDLAYLARELPRMHPDLFSMVSEEQFRNEVANLDMQIKTLEEVRIRAGLARIVALPNDGHTIPNIFSLNLDWHVYPLAIHFFDDQLIIVDACREHRDLIGSRIMGIDNTPIATAMDRMEGCLSSETPSMRLERLCNSLGVAEWLFAAEVATIIDRADYEVVDSDGHRSTVTIDAVHYLPCIYWMMARKVDDGITSIAIKGERKSNYRFEFLPDLQTLYFQFNLVSEEGQDETLAEFIARLEDFAATNDFERFVIDVRNNDGGDGRLLPPLVDFLAQSERINREGHLFLLISRRTYSAAAMFTAMMQNNTMAITVGERTSQGCHFFSSPELLKLPNSGMEFLVSSRQTSASLDCDQRSSIEPDLPVQFTREDHFGGRDPCLQAAIAYEPNLRMHMPVSEDVSARILGQYRLSPLQVLKIHEANGQLRLQATDFLASSTQNVSTRLHQITPNRLQTDIPGVEIRFAPGTEIVQTLNLIWRDEIVSVNRMPSGERLPMELLQQGRIDEGVQSLIVEKEHYLKQVPALEDILNNAGYEHLRSGRLTEAISLFRLNVDLFPESANVYDSLGEAYLVSGDKVKAIANYRHSLQLNPRNNNASEVLADLEH